ncbi:MAG TPA: hypothetical protein DEQ69_06195 [Rhodobacteraceae bacterium]|nr:hypothetical protein [Paracoccaceae bacterium]
MSSRSFDHPLAVWIFWRARKSRNQVGASPFVAYRLLRNGVDTHAWRLRSAFRPARRTGRERDL